MESVLERLDAYVAGHGETAFFGAGAREEVIAKAEGVMGVKIPAAYRAFLLRHDGGFIDISEIGAKRLKAARWNSHAILSVAEVVEEYGNWARIAAEAFGWEGKWPYVPMCQTENQELLVLGPGKGGEEAAVVDAFHEAPPAHWGVLYPSFEAFLEAYLEGEGRVETVG